MSFFICLKLDSTSRDIMKRVFAIWNKFVDQGELNFVRILCIRAIWYWLGFSFIKSHRGMECDWKTLTDLLYACECCNSCDGYFIVLSDTLKKAQKKKFWSCTFVQSISPRMGRNKVFLSHLIAQVM